ncbi:hypothetical protein L1887_34510 [Cichorium endivia]|nr:hypothetical protein L1887_34510 [Cichorium endivia]
MVDCDKCNMYGTHFFASLEVNANLEEPEFGAPNFREKERSTAYSSKIYLQFCSYSLLSLILGIKKSVIKKSEGLGYIILFSNGERHQMQVWVPPDIQRQS